MPLMPLMPLMPHGRDLDDAGPSVPLLRVVAEPGPVLVALVAGFRAFEKTVVKTDRRTLVTFIALVVLLTVLSAPLHATK
jgi:hypothetical protein